MTIHESSISLDLDRFYSNTIPHENCLLWTASLNSNDHGTFTFQGKAYSARRWIYEQIHGPLEKNISLKQLCQHSSCVFVDHLSPQPAQQWTDEEIGSLQALYADPQAPINLIAFAKKIGRNRANISRKARSLGLTNQYRRKKPEGQKIQERKYASADERNRALSAIRKAWIAEHGHPRGALGLSHSPEARKKISMASRRSWQDPSSKLNSPEVAQKRSDLLLARILQGEMRQGYSRTKGGKRPDLDNRYFRSSWEANYARYLNWIKSQGEILTWEYETHTFVFEAIERGTRAYTPDFKIIFDDGRYEWHEVKGWMDNASKVRLRRMKKYFPEEKIIIIDKSWFSHANRIGLSRLINGWE